MSNAMTPSAETLARLIAERVVQNLRCELANVSPWLTPDDAAAYLSLTKRGLEDMRAQITGPRYHRVGTRIVRYHRNDLDHWLLSGGCENSATGDC